MGGGDSQAVSSALQANITALYHTDYAFAATNLAGDIIVWGGAKAGGSFTYKTSSQVHIQQKVHVTSLVSSSTAFAGLTANHSLIVWGNPYEGGRFHPVSSSSSKSSLLVHGTNIVEILGNDVAFLASTNQSNSSSQPSYWLWGNTKVVLGQL